MIDQVEKDKSMKSDFEAMILFIFPFDLVVNNKATTVNKNNEGIISKTNTKISSTSVGGCNRSTGVDLRFYKREVYYTLSKEAKETLKKW